MQPEKDNISTPSGFPVTKHTKPFVARERVCIHERAS